MRTLLAILGSILLLFGIVLGFALETRAWEIVLGAGLLMLGKAAFLYLTPPENNGGNSSNAKDKSVWNRKT